MSQPATAQVTVHGHEFGQLMEISALFMYLSIIAQGVDKQNIDVTLTRLQQLRPLIERFSEFATVANAPKPVEVLNHMAKKQISSLVAAAQATQMCTISAHMFQTFVIHAMKSLAVQAPGQVQVDPRKMH